MLPRSSIRRRRTDHVWVAEPPASCRTCGAAASTRDDDDSRHEGEGGDGKQGERAAAEFPARGPGANRHSTTSSERRARLSPFLLPSHTATVGTTKAMANDDNDDVDEDGSTWSRRAGCRACSRGGRLLGTFEDNSDDGLVGDTVRHRPAAAVKIRPRSKLIILTAITALRLSVDATNGSHLGGGTACLLQDMRHGRQHWGR